MKALMGFGFFMLFLAGIALVMLQGRQMAQQGMSGGGAAITGISWRPVVIGTKQIPKDSRMFVQFGVDGSITGNGGCNGFSGSLQQSESGVEVGPLGATRMACPEVIMDREMAFLDALHKTTDFDFGTTTLRLLDDGNNALADLVGGAGD